MMLLMQLLLLLEGHHIGLLLMLLRRLLNAVSHRNTKHVRILVVPAKQEGGKANGVYEIGHSISTFCIFV